ncbi:MAG: methyltransferase domain-containing protein [Methylococcales bacterium]
MKLNLGCGNKKKEGFIGVDKYPCGAVDKISDINETLPFATDSIDEIWADNIIEHVNDISRFMRECHRISKDNGVMTIFTPHYSSNASWRDPTHLHHLSYFSMDHFEKPSVDHYTGGGFKVVEKKLSFGGGIMGITGRLIFMASPKAYEAKWSFIFRASTLKFILQVVK